RIDLREHAGTRGERHTVFRYQRDPFIPPDVAPAFSLQHHRRRRLTFAPAVDAWTIGLGEHPFHFTDDHVAWQRAAFDDLDAPYTAGELADQSRRGFDRRVDRRCRQQAVIDGDQIVRPAGVEAEAAGVGPQAQAAAVGVFERRRDGRRDRRGA